MKTYQFRVVIEPDEDGWFVCCPLLERYGAATWGQTQEEAYRHIEEVLPMVLKSLIKHDEPIPDNEEDACVIAVTL